MALSFSDQNFITISDALDIAEDVTVNFYKFSADQWKRHRYEVKTFVSLNRDEVSQHAFALLNKGIRVINNFESKTKRRDLYFICLQDQHVLKALIRDKMLFLMPLLVYVFTHEFVHIVRFCNFFQRFTISGKEKEKEEKIVHATTFDILKNLSIPNINYVLESYRGHRIFEVAAF